MIIGLTGGIATGKSTVKKLFLEVGIPVIDCDLIARSVVEINEPAYLKIVETFGEEVILESGQLNRKKLADIIFNDEAKRAKLNSIVHPEVKKITVKEIKKYYQLGYKIVVIDVPLLFESGFDDLCDITVVVYAEEKVQYERLMKRDNLSYDQARVRIESQLSLSEKVKLADYVIDNSNSLLETKRAFQAFLDKIYGK